MRNPIIYLKTITISLVLLCIIVSCANDAEYVNPFPDIEIGSSDIKSIYYYNETLVLDPAVSYGESDSGELDFSYQWSLIGTDKIEVISEEKKLEYLLDSIGRLNLNFKVTNNKTGIIESQMLAINVESVSNQGFYVLKQTQDGKTDFDGFYVSSAVPDYNIVKKNYGESLSGVPVGFAFSPAYKVKTPGTNFYSSVSALLLFSEHDAITYNVNNSRPLSTLKEMFFLNEENNQSSIKTSLVSNGKVFITKSDKAYSMNSGNPAFFPAIKGDYNVEGLITTGSSGHTLAFDKKNERFVMFASADYATSDTIGYFRDRYSEFNNGLQVSVNNMNGQAVFLENTQRGSGYTAQVYAYSLFRKNSDQNALTLYGMDYHKLARGLYYHYPIPGNYSNYTLVRAGQFSPISFERRLDNALYPELTSAKLFAMNKNSNILYFVNGHNIGKYNIDDQSYNTSFISGIPADEEITFMKFIKCNYSSTDTNFSGLVVATYNSGSDTYKIYRFQLDGLSSVSLQSDIKTGQGKVAQVLYVSARDYNWSGELHLYN